MERALRDGRTEEWWALEAERGPYGPEKGRRLVVVATDPDVLPERTTRYLRTNLPAPGSRRAERSGLAPASVAEVVRLYGLRMWVEQSYKQVKHALGWSDYQVRSDPAIRRHWQLACCAFSFCWWAYGRLPTEEPTETEEESPAESAEGGGKETPSVVAGDLEGGEGVAGAVDNVSAILEGVYRSAPAAGAKSVA